MNKDKLEAIVGLLEPDTLANMLAAALYWRSQQDGESTAARQNVDAAAGCIMIELIANQGTLAALKMVMDACEQRY